MFLVEACRVRGQSVSRDPSWVSWLFRESSHGTRGL